LKGLFSFDNPDATAHAFRAAMKLTVCCYDNRSDWCL